MLDGVADKGTRSACAGRGICEVASAPPHTRSEKSRRGREFSSVRTTVWTESEWRGKERGFSPTLFTSSRKICPRQSDLPTHQNNRSVNLQFLGLLPEARPTGEGGRSNFISSRGLAPNRRLMSASLQRASGVGDPGSKIKALLSFVHQSLLLQTILFSLIYSLWSPFHSLWRGVGDSSN